MSKDWEKIARQVSLDMAHPLNYECIAKALAAAYRDGLEAAAQRLDKFQAAIGWHGGSNKIEKAEQNAYRRASRHIRAALKGES